MVTQKTRTLADIVSGSVSDRNKRERLDKIIAVMSPGISYSVSEIIGLSKNTDTSEKTIQRDLQQLVSMGRLNGGEEVEQVLFVLKKIQNVVLKNCPIGAVFCCHRVIPAEVGIQFCRVSALIVFGILTPLFCPVPKTDKYP